MKKSFYILLVLFIGLVIAGLSLHFTQTKDKVLDKYTQDINAQLNTDYLEVLAELSKPSLADHSFNIDVKNPDLQKKLYAKSYTILAYQNDSLVNWYNNKLFLTDELVKALPENEGAYFVKTSNAYAYLVKKNYPSFNGEERYVIGLIPIKYAYQITKLAGSNTFQAGKNIPIAITVDETESKYAVQGPAGGVRYLAAKKDFKDTPTQKKLFVIFSFAFLIFLLISNQIANWLSVKDPAHGTFFLVAILTFVSLFIGFIDPSTKLGGLGILAETLQIEILGSSLIVVFFYSISFVWLMIYLNQNYVFKEEIQMKNWIKYAVSVILNISLMTGIVMVLEIYRQIVVWSEIDITFLGLLQRKLNSILGLSVMLIALAALVLLALWMIKLIKQIRLTRIERSISISVAFSVVLAYLFLSNSVHNNQIWYGTAILLPFALDYYVSERPKREPYAVYMWFALIAIFASVSLYLFQNEREMKEMESYSHILSEERDTTAEAAVFKVSEKIATDPKWKTIYKAEPFLYNSKEAGQLISKYFKSDLYLTNNYSYRFFLYTDSEVSFEDHALMDQGLSRIEYKNLISTAEQISATDNLYLRNSENGSYSYFIESRLQFRKSAILVLELKSEISGNVNLNSPIFSSHDDMARMKNIGQYDYILYKDEQCIRYKGDLQRRNYSLPNKPKIGENLIIKDKGYISFVYHNPNGNIVQLRKPSKGLFQWSSLFAMLFFLISVLAAIFNVFDKIFNIIPDGINIKLLPGNTFYAKIQSGFLVLIYISFIAIGGITALHFNKSNKEYHDGRLSRKSKTINTDISFSLNKLEGSTSLKTLQKEVVDRILPLSKTHKMESINFFDTKGGLIFSSKDEIYQKGVAPREMDANTFNYLSNSPAALKINPEHLGDVEFKSSYFSILHYGKLVGYLGIPYYTKEQARLSDLNDFVNNLLITYIILFVMAISFIVYGTKILSKPIKMLEEGVKKNKAIEWKEDDEFKGIVNAYNEFLRAKETQHQLEVKIEKESAWRELAKQVAHDIKNPLTPIQLHIQHFQKSIHDRRMDMDQIEERTDRVTHIILTQIKKLLGTVEDFQDMSNVNEGVRENVSVNKILLDVKMLHEKEINIDVLVDLPDEEVFVMGNSGKLERVFANLTKNAVQAIPEDSQGIVVLQMKVEDNHAVITITDNGSGIPDHIIGKVFTPNFTTKSSGTGLGLHICKNIIESHNGNIDFITERGKGTTFTVKMKTSRIMSHLDQPTKQIV